MRFVCAGDIHLGSGPDLHPGGAKARLAEQEAVLGQIVDAANELEAPLLWAGDAWEHRRPTPAQVLAFRRQLSRLQNGAIVIPGNHDVEAFEEPTGYDLLDSEVPNLLDIHAPTVANQPQIVTLGDGYNIACLPWAPPHRLVALDEGTPRSVLNARLADGLLDIARGLYAQMPVDAPRILLGHWAISGAALPSGLPTDQMTEPIVNLAELEAIGYDAIVFGHIHRAQMLSQPDSPPAFYTGSPMPLNFGEVNVDHCCWLLEIDAGNDATAYRLPLRFPALQTIDTEAVTIGDEVQVAYKQVEEGATVKIRVAATQEQARRLDVGALRRDLVEVRKARHVWSVEVNAERGEVVRGAAVDEGLDDVETFTAWLDLEGALNGVADEDVGGYRERLRERHQAIVEVAL